MGGEELSIVANILKCKKQYKENPDQVNGDYLFPNFYISGWKEGIVYFVVKTGLSTDTERKRWMAEKYA